MKITIITTRSGWLVCRGEVRSSGDPNDVIANSWTFNSLDKAIACIRGLMKPPKPDLSMSKTLPESVLIPTQTI